MGHEHDLPAAAKKKLHDGLRRDTMFAINPRSGHVCV
jgi:hypothetical protein